MCKLNAKGSLTTEIVIWLAVIVSTMIALAWLMQNFSFQKPVFEKLENDVGRAGALINNACQSYVYKNKFNPQTEDGNVVLKDNKICFNNSGIERCRIVLCEVKPTIIDLKKTSNIWVEKKEDGKVSLRAE